MTRVSFRLFLLAMIVWSFVVFAPTLFADEVSADGRARENQGNGSAANEPS